MADAPAVASHRFPALGGLATVAMEDSSLLDDAVGLVRDLVTSFDGVCSRFREDSELTALNTAAGRTQQVSPLLFDALTAALRAARLSGGRVDPTVGAALISLGYDRRWEDMPAACRPARSGATGHEEPDGVVSSGPPAPLRLAEVPGWRVIKLDPAGRTVRVPRGVRLDLGATAKALAADRAAAAVQRELDVGVLVSLSGDISLAGTPPPGGWRVRVTDDHRAPASAPGQWVTLHSGGLATSCTAVRTWVGAQGPAHHLIDPSTGAPAKSCWRTISVAARSCLDANIASTAGIVGGFGALSWLETMGLPCRLVDERGRALHRAGWPEDGDDLG